MRFLNLRLGSFRAARHRHPQLELTWIEQGEGIRYVGDSAEVFGTGDMVLLGPDLAHTWISAVRQERQPLRAKVIQFEPSVLQAPAVPEMHEALAPLQELLSRGVRVTGLAHARLAAALTHMVDASDLDRVVGLLHILSVLAQQPQDLVPIATATLGGQASAKNTVAARQRRIDRVLEWMRANLAQPIAPHQAAQVAHVTPAAFSRFFRREVGKTFAQYLMQLRCTYACVLLRSTRDPVAEVARHSGFCAVSHFNRQFKQHTGLTPRAYREGQ